MEKFTRGEKKTGVNLKVLMWKKFFFTLHWKKEKQKESITNVIKFSLDITSNVTSKDQTFEHIRNTFV